MKLIITVLSILIVISSPSFCVGATPDINDSTGTPGTETSVDQSQNTTDMNDSTPVISREDAIKDAKAKLEEPGPVRDLTDPGVVYSQLSEGVSAWISSLEGNRDSFGNEVTGSYVTASRPDVVPASLQAFLLGYYKGDNKIGLAFGPDGVASATSEIQNAYNESVVKLADEIIEECGNSAVQPSDTTNNAEDVPALNNDNDEESGTTNQDTTPPADPAVDYSNLSGSSAIEEKYKVDLQSGDKDFTPAELIAIDKALGFLPSNFYAPRELNNGEQENPTPTRIMRTASINSGGAAAFGIFKTKAPAHIEIADAAWDMYDCDYPTPPFTELEAREAQFGGTLVHEMLHRNIATDENGDYYQDLVDKPFIRDWATQFGWSSSGGTWTVQDKSTCVTNYSSMVNPEEDLAESVMMYVYWPNRLKAVNQEKFDFIKNTIGVAESGNNQPYPE
jgi:hypothetical protein